MMGFKSRGRALIVFLMIATLLVATRGAAFAQDTAGTPIVATNDSVTVACTYEGTANQSTCDFTLVDTDQSSPTALTILASELCASPIGIGSTVSGGGAFTQDVTASGATATLTFAGQVSQTSGPATYRITVSGQDVAISGDSISCAEATGSPPGNGSASEAGSPSGNGGASEAASATVTPVPKPAVTATINFYDCTADPLDVAPAASSLCTQAAAVGASVTIDGVASTSITSNGSGIATVDAPEGSTVVVTEDQNTITSGYVPYGEGAVTFTAAAGQNFNFVHLPRPDVGRVQITSGTCPTSGDSRTSFRVIEPGLVTAAASSCAFTPNVAFTITGGALASAFDVTTGSNGSWLGFLPGGDYTVTSADSTSASFTVYNEEIVVIIAIGYQAQPTGTLAVARWECAPVETAEVSIDVAAKKPGNPADCAASNGGVSLTEVGSSADPAKFKLGDGGAFSVDLKPASYVLTDDASGQTASFTLGAGETLYATITGRPAVGGTGGSAGNESDGNVSGGNGSGNGADNGNGTADGGNGVDSGAGTANGANAGGASPVGASVTSLPDTGVHESRSNSSLPLGGALITLLIVAAAAFAQRRKSIGQP